MRSFFTLALVVLGFYLAIRLISSLIAGSFGSRYRAYRQLAARFRGVCEARGLVDPPTVTFSHQGASVRVGLAPVVPGQPSSPRTRVVVRFARALQFRLELFPRKRPTPPQPPRGTREVSVGRADFDARYLVQANDPEIARHLLDAEPVRVSIELLRQLCPPDGLLLSVNPERLLLQIDRDLGASFPALDAMVRSALYLHETLEGSVLARISEGIEVVQSDGPDTTTGPPTCEVCGQAIVGAHVSCEVCKTPCHSDCWMFFGGCSTFGCQGKKSIAVRGA
jgi:hypothetical protein